jgi:hypothetical protein
MLKGIGRANNNFNWHATCKLHSHYEESDVFLAEPACLRCRDERAGGFLDCDPQYRARLHQIVDTGERR